jgi:hypothetical protein
MLVVPNQGEQILLDAATGKTPATSWTLRLFATDHTPAKTDTEADYIEAAGGDYAPFPLNAANWATTPGSPTLTRYLLRTFSFTGALTGNPTVYGYYISRDSGGIVYAERFAQPFTPANPGDAVDVTAQLTLGSVSSD